MSSSLSENPRGMRRRWWFKDALAHLGFGNRRKRLGGRATWLIAEPSTGGPIESIKLTYHGQPVLTFYPDKVVYDSGGWESYTTKARMNEYGPVGVYQRKGKWYMDDGTVYHDGMEIIDSGAQSQEPPAWTGPDPVAQTGVTMENPVKAVPLFDLEDDAANAMFEALTVGQRDLISGRYFSKKADKAKDRKIWHALSLEQKREALSRVLPKIYYHGTTTDALPKILKHGLQPAPVGYVSPWSQRVLTKGRGKGKGKAIEYGRHSEGRIFAVRNYEFSLGGGWGGWGKMSENGAQRAMDYARERAATIEALKAHGRYKGKVPEPIVVRFRTRQIPRPDPLGRSEADVYFTEPIPPEDIEVQDPSIRWGDEAMVFRPIVAGAKPLHWSPRERDDNIEFGEEREDVARAINSLNKALDRKFGPGWLKELRAREREVWDRIGIYKDGFLIEWVCPECGIREDEERPGCGCGPEPEERYDELHQKLDMWLQPNAYYDALYEKLAPGRAASSIERWKDIDVDMTNAEHVIEKDAFRGDDRLYIKVCTEVCTGDIGSTFRAHDGGPRKWLRFPFVFHNGLYFDIDCPDGVEKWWHLPKFPQNIRDDLDKVAGDALLWSPDMLKRETSRPPNIAFGLEGHVPPEDLWEPKSNPVGTSVLYDPDACPECSGVWFTGTQTQHWECLLNKSGFWEENLDCYEADDPAGPFYCHKCESEYKSLCPPEKNPVKPIPLVMNVGNATTSNEWFYCLEYNREWDGPVGPFSLWIWPKNVGGVFEPRGAWSEDALFMIEVESVLGINEAFPGPCLGAPANFTLSLQLDISDLDVKLSQSQSWEDLDDGMREYVFRRWRKVLDGLESIGFKHARMAGCYCKAMRAKRC